MCYAFNAVVIISKALTFMLRLFAYMRYVNPISKPFQNAIMLSVCKTLWKTNRLYFGDNDGKTTFYYKFSTLW